MRAPGWEKKTKKLGPTWGEALPLQWDDFSKTLKNILATKYFFRRFSKKQLVEYLKYGMLTSYLQGDVIFLKNRIGVVVSGSVFVKNHPGHALSQPRILFKATEGHVIGFEEGENCGGLTTDPLSWMVSHGKQTEIMWFDKEDFMTLWNLQKEDTAK
jgi:hypothetical protein